MDYVQALEDIEWSDADTPGLGAEFAFTPDVITDDYTSAYRAKFARISAGGRSETHVDAHNHAFYIISGSGEVRIEDRLWQMRSGSVVKVPRGLPTASRTPGARTWSSSQSSIRRRLLPSKGLQGIKVLLPVLRLVGVECASRTRFVINSL
ncbi:cupin domain-containing protein [Streptomyces chiangmaiensis]